MGKLKKMGMMGILALLVLAGCKPTERGYQQAYDAAKQKREQVQRENMLPAEGLQSDEGPQQRVISGDTVYVDRQRLRTEEGQPLPKSWYVAVGVYKMNTNAKANAARLREKGWKEAQAVKGQQGRWYTMAAGAGSLDSVRVIAKQFKKENKQYPYVGLPGSPVLVSAW